MPFAGLWLLLGLSSAPEPAPAPAPTVRSAVMQCGPGVPLCGVLTLETGEGPGLYGHPTPSVHGLWPETGAYGSSACIRPRGSAVDPAVLFPCYAVRGGIPSQELWFETHEWGKHGTCAGVADATDFFTQVCSLSSAPLEVLSASRAAGKSLPQMQSDLESASFAVFSVDTANSQFELSACASNDGVWKLAPVSRFPALCNGTVPPQPPPDPPPSPALTCKPFTHGPPCVTDLDCALAPHCVRCAHSGFCTDVKLPPILLD